MLDPNLETTIDTTLGVTLLSFGCMNIDKKLYIFCNYVDNLHTFHVICIYLHTI